MYKFLTFLLATALTLIKINSDWIIPLWLLIGIVIVLLIQIFYQLYIIGNAIDKKKFLDNLLKK